MALKRFTDNERTPEKKDVSVPLTSSKDNTDYYATGGDIAEIVLNNTARLWDLKAKVIPTCRSFRDPEYLQAGSWFFEDISNTEDKPDKLKEKKVQFARLLCESGQSKQEGLKFIKQYLFYINMTDNELELSMRGVLLNGSSEVQGATPWKTGVDEADVAKNAKSADIATSVIDNVKNQSKQTLATVDGKIESSYQHLSQKISGDIDFNKFIEEIYWGRNYDIVGAGSLINGPAGLSRPCSLYVSACHIYTLQIVCDVFGLAFYRVMNTTGATSVSWQKIATTNGTVQNSITHKALIMDEKSNIDNFKGKDYWGKIYAGSAKIPQGKWPTEVGGACSISVQSLNYNPDDVNNEATLQVMYAYGTDFISPKTLERRYLNSKKTWTDWREYTLTPTIQLQAYNQGITKEI